MATNKPGMVYVKSGTALKGTNWALSGDTTYGLVDLARARLQLTAAGSLSGLAAIDGVTPSAGDMILVSQGVPATDGLYLADASTWKLVALVSSLPDGFQVNVWDGNSSPTIYIAQG